jgi:hypothetical protein
LIAPESLLLLEPGHKVEALVGKARLGQQVQREPPDRLGLAQVEEPLFAMVMAQ